MASKTAAYFKIKKSHGKKVLNKLMNDYEGVAISDRYSIYAYKAGFQTVIATGR